MADGPDIDIRFTTEADTTGADETKQAIKEVDKAALDAQRDQDVETAKQRQAARAAKEHSDALREIADAQHMLVAANLADAIGKVSGQFKGLSPEIDMCVGSTQTFLSVLASTGNPIAALLALTGSAISSLIDAERSSAATIKKVDKEIAESHEKMKAARAAWALQVKTENLQEFFKKELQQLELQEAALGRIFQIREKERALDAAKQRGANEAAVRGGADPFAAQAAEVGEQQTNAIKAVQDNLTEASKQLEIAVTKANQLKSEAQILADSRGGGDAVAVAAKNAAEAAAANVVKLQEALPDLQKMAQLDIATIQEETKTKLSALNEQAGRALAKNAEEEIEKLRARAAESGQTISAGMETIISQITAATKDGLVESKELPALVAQLQRIRSTREGNDKQLMEGVGSLLQTTTTMASRLPSILEDIKALKATVEQLNSAPK